MQPNNCILLYCYDAYCNWCYGFRATIKKITQEYATQFHTEVISGGMLLPKTPVHIQATAAYMQQTCKQVAQLTGATFGSDFLWHIDNADQSDWYPNSEKPAIALSIFKELYPEQQLIFSCELQTALFAEGRDLCDDESYRHIVKKYKFPAHEFYSKLRSNVYQEKARYEFSLVHYLQVRTFPALLLQTTGAQKKVYAVAAGYTPYETVKENIEKVLKIL